MTEPTVKSAGTKLCKFSGKRSSKECGKVESGLWKENGEKNNCSIIGCVWNDKKKMEKSLSSVHSHLLFNWVCMSQCEVFAQMSSVSLLKCHLKSTSSPAPQFLTPFPIWFFSHYTSHQLTCCRFYSFTCQLSVLPSLAPTVVGQGVLSFCLVVYFPTSRNMPKM